MCWRVLADISIPKTLSSICFEKNEIKSKECRYIQSIALNLIEVLNITSYNIRHTRNTKPRVRRFIHSIVSLLFGINIFQQREGRSKNNISLAFMVLIKANQKYLVSNYYDQTRHYHIYIYI